MAKGLFITLEGNDGCGKTTQGKLVFNYLTSLGYEVVHIREPGGTKISEKIREIILDKENDEMNDVTEVMLYASARAQLVREVISPAINEGKIVLCDRYVDSNYAYQGYGRGVDINIVRAINEIATDGIMPDITLFFDISPDVAMSRRLNESSADRLESLGDSFYNKVYLGYKELAGLEPDRIISVNADSTPERIFSDVKNILQQKILEWRG